jgi:hypothetical protein
MANPHRKLVNLLSVSLLAASALVGFAASGAALPAQQSQATFQTRDQVVESFDQIVPGMTQAQDLPMFGFDTANGALLSYSDVTARFLTGGKRWKAPVPAVRDCLKAPLYCNAYVFHVGDPGGKSLFASLGGARPWTAEVTLLVMNGRVIHKVLS